MYVYKSRNHLSSPPETNDNLHPPPAAQSTDVPACYSPFPAALQLSMLCAMHFLHPNNPGLSNQRAEPEAALILYPLLSSAFAQHVCFTVQPWSICISDT